MPHPLDRLGTGCRLTEMMLVSVGEGALMVEVG